MKRGHGEYAMHKREKLFARRLDFQGKLWFFQPKSFKLPAPHRSYLPDFYVVNDNEFIEVVGSRQAHSQNRVKYDAFRDTYPDLRLVIVNAGAWKMGQAKKRVVSPKRTPAMTYKSSRMLGELPLVLIRIEKNPPNAVAEKIVALVKGGRFKNVGDVAKAVGVSRSKMSMAMHGFMSENRLAQLANTMDAAIGRDASHA